MTASAHPIADSSPGVAEEDELIARWIEPDPIDPSPESAWIVDNAVSITSVVSRWQIADGDVEQVVHAYGIPAEAVAAALAYYRRHHAVIDAWITTNLARWPE